MNKLLGAIVAMAAFAGTANATDIPFVPDCRMEYKVATVNLWAGIGGGSGTIYCNDKYDGETAAEVDIAILQAPAVGVYSEEGVIYAAGVGLNTNNMLGVLAKAQAGFALGKGVSMGAGVMLTTSPSVQVYITGNDTKGLGVALGYGAWFFAESEGEDGNAIDTDDSEFWHNQD
jgi:hypothetical protein